MKYTSSIEIGLPREKWSSWSPTRRTCRSGCAAWYCTSR